MPATAAAAPRCSHPARTPFQRSRASVLTRRGCRVSFYAAVHGRAFWLFRRQCLCVQKREGEPGDPLCIDL